MTNTMIPLAALFTAHDGTQYVRMTRTTDDLVMRTAEGFGVTDAKGREIGHRVVITMEVWVVDADANTLVRTGDVEMYSNACFRVQPHALRDGAAFGALPVASYKRFPTLELAQAYAAHVMARAAKKARGA